MKGTFKAGFKYISNIFVVKEDEIEIGLPTDVKHVAHIGWDGQSANTAPSWMKDFKTGPDFSASSIATAPTTRESPESTDFCKDEASAGAENPGTPTKKQKRRKPKSASSSTSTARAAKSKAKPVEDDNPKPADVLLV